MSTTTPTSVRLTTSATGSWLRHWDNGESILAYDEKGLYLGENPKRLAANIYRSKNADRRAPWTIRVFAGTDRKGEEFEGYGTLRSVRRVLAALAADWRPGMDLYSAMHRAADTVRATEAAEIQAENDAWWAEENERQAAAALERITAVLADPTLTATDKLARVATLTQEV